MPNDFDGRAGSVNPTAPTEASPLTSAPPAPGSTKNLFTTTFARIAGALGIQRTSQDTEPPRSDPRRVGRFLILQRVGEGGMGVVYSAYDEQLDRKIAIKLVRPDAQLGRRHTRVLREAQAMARLSHPNVAQVYEVGEFEGQIFLAMEFINGITLKEWLADEERDWKEILRIFIEAGRGLEAAHAEGLVHRDFKPGNVIIDRNGRPRVLDFGLAYVPSKDDEVETVTTQSRGILNTPLTVVGTLLGTPAYMSPEQHSCKPTDARSDQFSFCIALYEGLYGTRPYDGKTLPILAFQVKTGIYTEPSDLRIPRSIWPILKRGLDPDSDKRWPKMGEPLTVLEGVPTNIQRRPIFWPSLTALGMVIPIAASIVLLLYNPRTHDYGDDSGTLIERAHEYGSKANWVFPPISDPRATAYIQILAIESINKPTASSLRKEFSNTLTSLGNQFWDDMGGNSYARDYYAQAYLFDPENELALTRSGYTRDELEMLREKASAAFARNTSHLGFTLEEITRARVHLILTKESTPPKARSERALDSDEQHDTRTPLNSP